MDRAAPVDLAALIEAVEARRGPGPLSGIEEASGVAAQMAALSDRLIGYYVERARSEGHSWTEIGALIGITRQAAQQRFGARTATLGLADLDAAGALSHMTKRTREALYEAESRARRLRHPAIDPAHVLVILVEHPECLAAKALQAIGVKTAALRRQIAKELVPGKEPSPPVVPLTAATRRLLTNALTEALQLGHNYVGTEHLLLGATRDRGAWSAGLLADAGVNSDELRRAVVDLLNDYLRQRT